MDFTFKVLDKEGSEEFLKFIEKFDFVVPMKKKKSNSKKNKNIIPAENPNGDPVMLTGAFSHIKDIDSFRKSLWQRK